MSKSQVKIKIQNPFEFQGVTTPAMLSKEFGRSTDAWVKACKRGAIKAKLLNTSWLIDYASALEYHYNTQHYHTKKREAVSSSEPVS